MHVCISTTFYIHFSEMISHFLYNEGHILVNKMYHTVSILFEAYSLCNNILTVLFTITSFDIIFY